MIPSPSASSAVVQEDDDIPEVVDMQYEEGYDDNGQYDDSAIVEGTPGHDAAKGAKGAKGAGNISKYADLDQYIQRNVDNGRCVCLICSYSYPQFQNVKNHVESKHFPNSFTYSCPYCSKVFGTNQAYMTHKSRYHK